VTRSPQREPHQRPSAAHCLRCSLQ
jgi:hypothetical protein